MSIWSSTEAEFITKGKSSKKWHGNKITLDSRSVEQNDIFIALKGANHDGHDYIAQAEQKGANAAIISKSVNCNIPTLKVNDTTQALVDLAKYKRNNSDAFFIAITGSAGKTSTKTITAQAFQNTIKTYTTRANYNGQIGMPICLASMPDNTELGVFELGMSQPGEMSKLSEIIKPDIAVITNIGATHAEFFNSTEDIAYAKAEIFDFTNKKGFALINQSSLHYDILHQQAKLNDIQIINFGKNSENHIQEILPDNNGLIIKANIFNQQIIYNMPNMAKHHIENSIIPLICAKLLDKNVQNIAQELHNYNIPLGRGNEFKINVKNHLITIIDDSYNSSPLPLKRALKNLGTKKGNKLAILSDMGELGENSILKHKEISKDIISNNIDNVITIGNLMSHLYNALPNDKQLSHCTNMEQAIFFLHQQLHNFDYILVKGSNYTKISDIIKFLKGL